MPKDVTIDIDSEQYNGEVKDQIKINTTGRLYDKEGTYYLKYKEDLGEVKEVKTTLKIKENKLSLIRQGKVRSIQEFIPEEKTEFDYKTQYGSLQFSIEVDNLSLDVSPCRGEIQLTYRLYNELDRVITTNYLNISYKDKEE